MTAKMERKLSEEQMRCVIEFRDAASSAESDEDLGRAFLALYLKLGRLQRGAEFDDARRVDIDAETIDRLHDLTELAPEHSLFEGFSRRLVSDPVSAMRYLSAHISTRSAVQSKRAKRPRRRDVFTEMIDELVRTNPRISEKLLIQHFRDHDDFELLDTEIRHLDTHETIPVSRLRSRLSDAKKRLNRKDSGYPG